MDSASYGLPEGSGGGFTLGSCHASTSQSVVETACRGQSTYAVPAANEAFGDPCVGIAKRLFIEVTCAM